MGKKSDKAKAENRVIDAADALDPNDRSESAEHLREVAGDIRDHLNSPSD